MKAVKTGMKVLRKVNMNVNASDDAAKCANDMGNESQATLKSERVVVARNTFRGVNVHGLRSAILRLIQLVNAPLLRSK